MSAKVVPDNTLSNRHGGLRAIIADVTYAEIINAFGQPNSHDIDEFKVDVEWILRTPNKVG